MGRREQVVAAALEVLVVRGGRGLSHRTVDAAAGVPSGTTSNYLRTRRDLLVGACEGLAVRNAARERFVVPAPANEAEFVDAVGAMLRRALGPRRTETIGHSILVFEAVSDPALLDYLLPEVEQWRSVFSGWLETLGASDPELGARLILSYLRALLLAEHAAPEPDFDPEDAVRPLVAGLLHGTS